MDSCRVWESHNEAAVRQHDGSDRNSPRAVYQVTEDSQSPAVSTESWRCWNTVVADGAASEGGSYSFGP